MTHLLALPNLETEPCRDPALEKTLVRRGGHPQFEAKAQTGGISLWQEGRNKHPWATTLPGCSCHPRMQGHVLFPRQGMEVAGVSPASRDAPCSVLHTQQGSRRDEEEVGVRRVTASLTCAGRPLRQPWGHGVSLQRRLLR